MFFQPSAQRTPSPVLGSFDESGPQGVALDVSADQQKVLIILDGKTLETALIDMSLAAGPVVGMHLSMLLMRITNVERVSRPVHRSVGPGDPTYTTGEEKVSGLFSGAGELSSEKIPGWDDQNVQSKWVEFITP